MIKVLRIDERLIHGQVAVAWTKTLNVTHIVLINDEAAKNDLQKAALKMAVPSGVKLAIKNVTDGIELLKDKRIEKMTLMIVVGNIKDAYTIASNVAGIEIINMGNFGKVLSNKSENQKTLTPYVKVSEEDIEVIKGIISLNIPFECQVLPDSTKKSMNSLLKGE